jgi:hypothetical protein
MWGVLPGHKDFIKWGDDISSGIMKQLYIFIPDFDILWNNKEQLLGNLF